MLRSIKKILVSFRTEKKFLSALEQNKIVFSRLGYIQQV